MKKAHVIGGAAAISIALATGLFYEISHKPAVAPDIPTLETSSATGGVRLAAAFPPGGLAADAHMIEVLHAAGFSGLNYWPSLDTTALAAFDRAAQLGFQIDLAWQSGQSTYDWIEANFPAGSPRRAALGYVAVGPDEPSPDTCPQDCIDRMAANYAYVRAHIPWVRTSVTLNARPALDLCDWAVCAAPYYASADVAVSDYYPWCWEFGDPSIVSRIVSATRTKSGKQTAIYQDGGQTDYSNPCPRGLMYPISSDFLVSQFSASRNAGAERVIWWFNTPYMGASAFNPVYVRDEQWERMVAAADSLSPVPRDCNADGIVDSRDRQLAVEAGNSALVARIGIIPVPQYKVYLPVVTR